MGIIAWPHPLALRLRDLQSLAEIGVDKNSTVVFPAPLTTAGPISPPAATANGTAMS